MTGWTTPVRRVAVVGLDGCGKSTVIAQLRRLADDRDGGSQRSFASITCPDFHDTPDAPLHRLSRNMKAFSDGCDEIGSAEMKALSMYLQMTLYGPVERFHCETFGPRVLVCERHPLIETFVYGPLYAMLAASHWDGAALEPRIRSVLDARDPDVFGSVRAWHAAEARRLDDGVGLWERFADVAVAVQADVRTAVVDFGARYRTSLPDAVLWLDVPPEQAAARCAARSTDSRVETHETAEFLGILRQSYLRVVDVVAEVFPDITVHVIDTGDGIDVAESVAACVEAGELFA